MSVSFLNLYKISSYIVKKNNVDSSQFINCRDVFQSKNKLHSFLVLKSLLLIRISLAIVKIRKNRSIIIWSLFYNYFLFLFSMFDVRHYMCSSRFTSDFLFRPSFFC